MSRSADVLTSIVEHKRLEVAAAKSAVPLAEINDRIASLGSCRGFETRIRRHLADGRSGIIAECKKASPSKGVIRADYRIAEIAPSYQTGGASCLSVLTDQRFFQGSIEHLKVARQVSDLPVLRKDFMIDAYQIRESRAIGADCILLITAVLELAELQDFADEATELGLDVLIEVHSEDELETALQVERGMLGINNRNLRTFETTLETSVRLSSQVPTERLVVSESGMNRAEDIQTLRSAGINVFLIGESLMRESNPGLALSRMFRTQRLAIEPGAAA